MTITAARPTGATPLDQPEACEARAGFVADLYGFQPAYCRGTRGLRYIEDATGRKHAYCAASGHQRNVRHRWGGQ